MKTIQRMPRVLGAVTAVFLAAGCQSLDVANTNEPDAARALGDPAAIFAVAGGTLRTWFNVNFDMTTSGPLLTMADAYTGSWNDFQMRFYSSEPRSDEGGRGWQNDPTSPGRFAIEIPWYGFYSMLSSANDVLTAITKLNLVIQVGGVDQTSMTEAIGRLAQGAALSSLALTYDSAFIVDETTDLTTLTFSHRQAVRDAALAKLDQAIALAAADTFFETPAGWTNGTSYTNTQIAQIARTIAARTLAYYPRNAAENAAVDWARVASYASEGMSSGTPFDFVFTGDGCGNFCNEVVWWMQDIASMRVDTRVARLLDPGTQQSPWPEPDGNPQPNSPDRRLGDGSYRDAAFASVALTVPATANAGTDYAWSGDPIFRPERGQYHQSNIGHIRYDYAGFGDPAGSGGLRGTTPAITRYENDLLWAEGLIRSGGSLATAADRINNSRVGRGNLPPALGSESVDSLLAKLQYEQDVEILANAPVSYYNRRRIDGLQPLTPRQMPVPARELGVLQKELYSYGGVNPDMVSAATRGGPVVKNVHQIYRELFRWTPPSEKH